MNSLIERKLEDGEDVAAFEPLNDAAFQVRVLGAVDRLSKRNEDLSSQIRKLRGGRQCFVSERCARHIGASTILTLDAKGQLAHLDGTRRKALIAGAEKIVGPRNRSALTSSDIPLPVEYGTEVAELVAEFGVARKYGTVVPVAGTAKLPRLKTSPAFGLLAQSTAVTEKSPQTEWVNFVVRKWGGMIRMPSEIEEDSYEMLGTWLPIYAAREMARCEDTVYFIADGTATYDGITGLVPAAIALGKVLQISGASPAEITLANMRAVRTEINSAALAFSAYYMSRTMEPLLCGYNTGGNTFYVNGPGGPTLDGYPIRWVEVLPVYTTSDTVSAGQVVFGDLRYQWLGTTGGMRFQISTEAAFVTDEVLIRALERFDIGLMADDALAVVQLGDS